MFARICRVWISELYYCMDVNVVNKLLPVGPPSTTDQTQIKYQSRQCVGNNTNVLFLSVKKSPGESIAERTLSA